MKNIRYLSDIVKTIIQLRTQRSNRLLATDFHRSVQHSLSRYKTELEEKKKGNNIPALNDVINYEIRCLEDAVQALDNLHIMAKEYEISVKKEVVE